jgi:hypothetical protein
MTIQEQWTKGRLFPAVSSFATREKLWWYSFASAYNPIAVRIHVRNKT